MAAGWYDGFFETGLNPWDMAAGSLIITEAGGLIGNFTGESDYLYQREVVAGNPKVYGQLVQLLAPYTRALKADEASADSGEKSTDKAAEAVNSAADVVAAALAATEPAAAAEPAARERKPVRIRKVEATPEAHAPAAPARAGFKPRRKPDFS